MSSMPLPNLPVPNELSKPAQRETPQGLAGTIAFVVGLSVLFGAALTAYVVVRTRVFLNMPALPWVFWISTFVVLVSSLLLQYAISAARLGRGATAYRALLASTGLGFLFLGLQGPGLVMLGQMNLAFLAVSRTLYILTIILISLHLLHVIGGVFVLSRAAINSEKSHYLGETGQLRPIALYWHFLTVVWVLLFSAFLVLN